MYICDFCSRPIGPRVKLSLVTFPSDIRQVEYTNEVPDPDSKEDGRPTNRAPKLITKVTHGTEIIQEFKQCPECAAQAEKEVVH